MHPIMWAKMLVHFFSSSKTRKTVSCSIYSCLPVLYRHPPKTYTPYIKGADYRVLVAEDKSNLFTSISGARTFVNTHSGHSSVLQPICPMLF